MTEKMNPEVKARWLAALRSGKYKQGHGRLRRGDAFCCLGVLCDVIAPDRWENDHHDMKFGMPSEQVKVAAGFQSGQFGNVIPKLEIHGVSLALDDHNDGDQFARRPRPARTFAEIANAIEAQL